MSRDCFRCVGVAIFPMASHILKLPGSKGLIFNFWFGKALQAYSEAVVVLLLADRDCRAIRTFMAVTGYISAAQRIGWDLTRGLRFPVVTAGGCPCHHSKRFFQNKIKRVRFADTNCSLFGVVERHHPVGTTCCCREAF